MTKWCAALCLLLAPLSGAQGNEIDGLDSPAVDISSSFTLGGYRPVPGQYGLAFIVYGADRRPTAITIQSRYSFPSPGRIACSTNVALPPGTTRASHPALSSSGFAFVSLQGPRGWSLYAIRRLSGIAGTSNRSHCQGWDAARWLDLEAPGQPIASAPDAVAVGTTGYTYVFVAHSDGRIAYRAFWDGDPSRHPSSSPWQSLAAAGVRSTPAVALYRSGDRSALHLFWPDASRRQINHMAAQFDPAEGRLNWGGQETRDFGDHLGPTTARTACTAGPEVTAPAPLFIVCGNDRGRGRTTYSIARYQSPDLGWGSEEAVELVGGRPWITRNLYGATSAPSLGPTGLADDPLMLVAFAPNYCPEEHIAPFAVRPAPGCIPTPFVAQLRYATIGARWEMTNRPGTMRWSDLN
jgi:hypothetical protein